MYIAHRFAQANLHAGVESTPRFKNFFVGKFV